MGLPGPEIELLVQNRGKELGRFVLTPNPGYPVPYGRRVVAVARADQSGAPCVPRSLCAETGSWPGQVMASRTITKRA